MVSHQYATVRKKLIHNVRCRDEQCEATCSKGTSRWALDVGEPPPHEVHRLGEVVLISFIWNELE